jgi:hypothetical protein
MEPDLDLTYVKCVFHALFICENDYTLYSILGHNVNVGIQFPEYFVNGKQFSVIDRTTIEITIIFARAARKAC